MGKNCTNELWEVGTQINECASDVAGPVVNHPAQAGEFGADGNRIAVGGNMLAAISMTTKDRNGPKISYQVLLIPATDASVDTESYHTYATGLHEVRLGSVPEEVDSGECLGRLINHI